MKNVDFFHNKYHIFKTVQIFIAHTLSAKIMLQSIVKKNSFEKAYSFLSDTFSNQLIEVRTRFRQGHEGNFKVTK